MEYTNYAGTLTPSQEYEFAIGTTLTHSPYTVSGPWNGLQAQSYKFNLGESSNMENCKKELATQTKITIDAMVQAGETDEFMTTVLYLAKSQNKNPIEVYASMTDTYNELQDYLGDEEEEE